MGGLGEAVSEVGWRGGVRVWEQQGAGGRVWLEGAGGGGGDHMSGHIGTGACLALKQPCGAGSGQLELPGASNVKARAYGYWDFKFGNSG